MLSDSSQETNSQFDFKTRLTDKLNKIEEHPESMPEADSKLNKLENMHIKMNEKIKIEKVSKDK